MNNPGKAFKARPLKLYHELMANKVGDILLVSCPYDAFIMEEEGRLSTRIINEYKGLNLSKPPKLTWVSSASEAFQRLEEKRFDLILAMPSLDGMDVYSFGAKVKQRYVDLPFFMLLHNTCDIDQYICLDNSTAIDRTYIWGGNADLLLAIIKNFEDEMNVAFDTENADVRVVILVEDSPYHYSSFLPVLYKQIVMQTQSVIDESINEEHRLLKMRGRPKVLVAHNYEEAMILYEKYKPFLLSVFSDMRYPKNGLMDGLAGYKLLTKIKNEIPDLPVLILSTEDHNREKVVDIPAVFINKNSSNLFDQIKSFFVSYLGFGAFVFRMPDGEEIARASDLRAIEKLLSEIPDESIVYHAKNNDFSRWFMARSEIDFALSLKPYKISDFTDPRDMKKFLIESIHARRKGSRQGQIIDFDFQKFDADTDFMKIGNGSLGGKARGLAFMASQTRRDSSLRDKFPDVAINIPQTFVISTEGFKTFIEENDLAKILESDEELEDAQIVEQFIQARFPDSLRKSLYTYLQSVRYPIAVRSSSLFEDAHYQPFAGLYNTYMLPNSHPNLEKRLEQLIMAVKLVYASTYLKAPRSYAKSTMHRTEDEEMAVVLQQLTGMAYNNYFYPSISGVAQSYNFYPISHLKAEEGVTYIALGLGKIVMEGGRTLRFCPKYPQFLPQFSVLNDILENSQKYFYALKLDEFPDDVKSIFSSTEDLTLEKLDLSDAIDHPVVRFLSSTFYAQDNRIRDSFSNKGFPVLTFANILKFNSFPLAAILEEVTKIGSKWMGTSVEVEFAVNLPPDENLKPQFSLLQIRPMGRYKQNLDVKIGEKEIKKAFGYSTLSLGNGEYKDILDVVYVDPETFDPGKTMEIAGEINKINALFNGKGKQYVLIGPGRWGSSDRWLGIPVVWNDISNVGVILETTIESIKADPSQGSHFFQNITSLGISYITISDKGEDFIDYEFFKCRVCENTTTYLKHIKFENPIKILVDGKTSQAVLMPYENDSLHDAMDDIPVITK
ncbi:MAG: phosphoenolpyruvate synthase PpsA [Desulfobacula sp.]|jgi:CheY-like chemotaxis protein|uniref:PEP/pyruvate-binding domain-containing protein n=1 Tax=Desulfobacula sp. TaxID=2593537 RepID=UPI001E16CA75|nr:phosphoenolpyruvate synthase PpsA [Desulfobacula sp.]MBT3485386.1 phosphoenolpyruvate synthase PpsA [Desulfobacula sp.]MBT3807107.1 phosphoenolpyruvate synthase PpsA [Desulfobacula sp.]MBT4027341.1 phosphoenolpyruvate synthase PpsA [Desulfobacula sp.]MBT4200513.1 phosphoenolpyruvate synthase PpsA [Desulfobacula sp.]